MSEETTGQQQVQQKPRKVIIGTPCHDGRVDVWYASNLAQTIKLGIFNGVEFLPIMVSYDSLLPRARNDIIKIALENEADDVVFIDSDQAWDPVWVLQLLNHPVDVVGGAVVKKTDDVELYNVRSNPPLIEDPTTKLTPVISVGTGFLRLSNKAMKTLYEKSEPYTNEGRENRMMFEIKILDGELYSEDVIICLKLKELGYQVWLDQNMTCAHIGPKMYKGNFKEWYARIEQTMQQEAQAKAKAEADAIIAQAADPTIVTDVVSVLPETATIQ